MKKGKIISLILAGVIASSTNFAGVISPSISNAASATYQSVSKKSTTKVTKKQVGTVTLKSLIMRSKSSTKGKKVLTLKKGNKVDIVKKMSNGWYQVKYKGKTGYVSGKYLKITTESLKKVGKTKTKLNMRSKNSTKGKKIATLKKGTKVDILKKMSNGWYQVKYKGKTGYVSGSYLTITTITVNAGNNNNNNSNTGGNTSKPTGVSMSAFESKLTSMGWKHDIGTTYTYQDAKTYQGMGLVRVTSKGAYFGLKANSSDFNNTIKKCFNLLLPSQGNRLYSIVSNDVKDQTLKMDGRTVVIKDDGDEIAVSILN